MEVSILAPTIGDPLPAVKWNYDELKAYLTAQLVDYKDRVYTPDNIKDARADRAKLNHVAKRYGPEEMLHVRITGDLEPEVETVDFEEVGEK